MGLQTDEAEEILIRRVLPEEAGVVSAITDAAYARYVPLIGRKPQPMTADYTQMIAENAVWLLQIGGQAAGVLVLVFEQEQTLIYSVALLPQHQKKGLGRRLLAWAEQAALEQGYRRIRLYTNALMVENIALYRRSGYQETGREAYLGTTLVHMAKDL